MCENHFKKIIRRENLRRFIGQLSLKDEQNPLEESRERAVKLFYELERKLQR